MRTYAFAALVTILTTACTTMNVSLPPSFTSGAESLPIHRKVWMQSKSPMSFGAYSVTAFHDAKKTRVAASNVVPPYVPDPTDAAVAAERTKQSIRFTLNEADQPRWSADCQSRGGAEGFSAKGVHVTTRSGMDTVCTFDSPDEQWTLNLWRDARLKGLEYRIKGELTDGTTTYDLVPLYQAENADGRRGEAPFPIGFALKDGERFVAVLDTMQKSPGAVLLPSSADAKQRSLAATTFAALLLQLEDRGETRVGTWR